jgi:hypothetical protein
MALVCALAETAARGGTTGAALPLPAPFAESRYRELGARSPFAVATSPAAPAPAATPDFAAQLYADGVARIADTDYVAIKSRDPDDPAAVLLRVGESTEDGIKIERIDWSNETGRSTVEVSKNGEKATLGFDQAQMKTVIVAPQPVMTAGLPPSRRIFWQQPTLEENEGPEAIVAKDRARLRALWANGQRGP